MDISQVETPPGGDQGSEPLRTEPPVASPPPVEAPRSSAPKRWSPLLLMAVGAAFLGALAQVTSSAAPVAAVQGSKSEPEDSPYEIPCPAGQLPDEGVCVPVPALGEALQSPGGPAAEPALPLRADRPAEYELYRFPVALEQRSAQAFRPAADQELSHAVRVSAPSGSAVQALRLDAQIGATEVVFATHGPPALVITAHRIQRERGLLTYLLVQGDLQSIEAPLLESMPSEPIEVADDAPLGKAGPGGLLLALRQVRRETKLTDAVPDLPNDAVFAVDLRNALPLLQPRSP